MKTNILYVFIALTALLIAAQEKQHGHQAAFQYRSCRAAECICTPFDPGMTVAAHPANATVRTLMKQTVIHDTGKTASRIINCLSANLTLKPDIKRIQRLKLPESDTGDGHTSIL